ncbi:hypothetical protein CLOSYM_00362 [[Clostridium] symbiosum ATCC 14940]|uniref:Uncharacterized protein n=1 Tax=[Clostridium] symbiosum ATCC 14940 TaxID=411472 RepID=A0ABC9U3C6_CLOSY|nr:hypothetical protein CLOSYM_00362 [[Clostridium] symbiosum ATCC 14940]
MFFIRFKRFLQSDPSSNFTVIVVFFSIFIRYSAERFLFSR